MLREANFKRTVHDTSTTTGTTQKMIVWLVLSKARGSCSHQERLNSVRTGAVMTSPTSLSTRKSGFQTTTSATSVTRGCYSTSPCSNQATLRSSASNHASTGLQPSALRAFDTGSGELRLRRGSPQSACCMVSGMSCFCARLHSA